MINETDGRTFLDRMREDTPPEFTLDDAQVSAMIEVFLQRFVTEAPGMKSANLTCEVSRVPGGWTVEIRKPNVAR